ncbi:hypothetical protein HanPSC8_Chr13g0548441 [Helianthus annuus]|nr:hypothetical protein HanPSC8_Chr13g0548441 [Helianthus annuus]
MSICLETMQPDVIKAKAVVVKIQMLFKVRMFICYINALKKSNGDGRFGLSEKAYGIHGGSSPQHRFKRSR